MKTDTPALQLGANLPQTLLVSTENRGEAGLLELWGQLSALFYFIEQSRPQI